MLSQDEPWQQLSSDFSKLESEEKSLNALHLGAMVISEPNPSCDLGDWKVHNGYSENFRARFELLASQADTALAPFPVGASSFCYRLHRLYQHLRETRSTHCRFFIESSTGGEIPLIDSVCEASSTFCLRIQKRLLERDQQKRVLSTCFQDWIEDNSVNVSIPPGTSGRNRVSIIAEGASTSIPIHFLSSRLQEINPSDVTEVGFPRPGEYPQ